MVFVCCTREQGASSVHFGHNAASGPDVDAGVVGAGAEEDVWGAVPEGDYFIRESVDWDAESSGQPKICELELALVVDEEILRL